MFSVVFLKNFSIAAIVNKAKNVNPAEVLTVNNEMIKSLEFRICSYLLTLSHKMDERVFFIIPHK